MAYLMFIGFDNSSRLCRNVYYFQYGGIRFKLIQNDCRKSCDVLLTILPSMGDTADQDRAYSVASEFLSAVSWENSSRVILQNLGGRGYPDTGTLRSAKCTFFSFPRIAFPGCTVGYDISVIPHLETSGQKTALHLYRDALSSNHDYLAFLFFWQILEIGGSNPVGWVNKTLRSKPPQLRLSASDLSALPTESRSIGNYLLDDCRHAIAHVERKPGKTALMLDSAQDARRIRSSTRVVQALAEFYIKNNLGLTKRLHLVRRNGRGFPLYADEAYLRTHVCKLAYERPSIGVLTKRK